ncbi:FAD binding domain-containing protein [Streptomyces sp. NPDC001594]|uniref:FAD binding domain-containing protein n=1 Tax=Streptomyces sp. NPDC001594 TaxID=3364590 RepID=UPI0036B0F882
MDVLVEEAVDGSCPLLWRAGDAWLAGGTTLFAEPRPGLRRLRDLAGFGWPALTVAEDGIEVAATCTVAELLAFAETPDGPWPSGRALIAHCCRAFSSSFKVWNTATVGGNLCTALPAGPMISLMVALRATLRLMGLDGREREVAARRFVTGAGRTVLLPGELLRSALLPAAALREPHTVRRVSTHPWGRSVALVTGSRDPVSGACTVTVTAATARPVSVSFSRVPAAPQLRRVLLDSLTPDVLFEDPHGRADWRRHLALVLAEEVRTELTERR